MMTAEEAKRIIREDPEGDIGARFEAIKTAFRVLGRSASMKDIWAWAERTQPKDARERLEEIRIELEEDRREIRKLERKRSARHASIFPGAIDYSSDRVQTSARNPMEEWMADIDEIDKEISGRQQAFGEKKDRYTAECDLWNEPVIWEHYINLTPWKLVGKKLGISKKAAYRQRKEYFERQRSSKNNS